MASNRQINKAKKERKGEVEQSGLFALSGMRGIGSFGDFCRELEHHAREGAEFAAVISNRDTQTDHIQRAYTALADKAHLLQDQQPDAETAYHLRKMLVRDLLAVTEMEKHIHTDALPINILGRVTKVAAFTALFAGAGLALGLGGDLAGRVLGEAISADDPTAYNILIRHIAALQSHNPIAESFITSPDAVLFKNTLQALTDAQIIDVQLPPDLLANTAGKDPFSVLGEIASNTMAQFDNQQLYVGLNEASLAKAGGVVGALLTAPAAITGTIKDISFANSYNNAARAADRSLADQAASEKFELALKLYNGDLTAGAKQEAAAVTSSDLTNKIL